MNETTSLKAALEQAEWELDAIAKETKVAYRRYRDLDNQQTAKATEVRELRQQIREEQK